MPPTQDRVDNVYWSDVDPDADNNAHAFALELIGRNKRVLELGPAAGHFTRALVAHGCRVVGVELDPDAAEGLEQVAERVVVGDLSDPLVVASAIDEEGFDVVVAGDVLEHLPDPLRVLQVCRGALRRGGYVVVSLPNVAHADVKLQLLEGSFAYRDTGLLDRTHLRFFTLDSIREMLEDAGLLMIDLRRVVIPVFHTEQAVDRAAVSPEVLASAVADAESETYQFVVRAVVHDGDAEVERLAERALALEALLAAERDRALAVEAERDDALAALTRAEELVLEASARADHFESLSEEHQRHIELIKATRSYRLLAPLRDLRARLG